MNSRLRTLVDNVTSQAQQHIGKLFAQTRASDFFDESFGDQRLRLLGDTVPLGEHGNKYLLHVHPAITEQEVVPGHVKLQYTFVVISPTGELREKRDAIELTRRPGEPNHAFVEMCTNLAPFMPGVREILDMLVDELEIFWPHRKFAHVCTATSADLDLVAIFVDLESLKSLAVDVGRQRYASL